MISNRSHLGHDADAYFCSRTRPEKQGESARDDFEEADDEEIHTGGNSFDFTNRAPRDLD